jgi:hypothetical protein
MVAPFSGLYHNDPVKFKRAILCYLILSFDRRLHPWLLLLRESRKSKGLQNKDDNKREQIAEWASNILLNADNFDAIIKVLAGDEYFEKNKRDIAVLERAVGKSVMELWDTDPVFEKFPHLRTLARNMEFEKMWVIMKHKIK